MFLLVCFFSANLVSLIPQDFENGYMMHSGQHNLLDLGIPLPRKWRQREGMLGQYWLVLGQYKLVLLGIRWYRVNKGLVCLYILARVEIWSDGTDA